jgi:hypothetical protein
VAVQPIHAKRPDDGGCEVHRRPVYEPITSAKLSPRSFALLPPGGGVACGFQASENGCRTLHMFSQALASGLPPSEQDSTIGFGMLRPLVRKNTQ